MAILPPSSFQTPEKRLYARARMTERIDDNQPGAPIDLAATETTLDEFDRIFAEEEAEERVANAITRIPGHCRLKTSRSCKPCGAAVNDTTRRVVIGLFENFQAEGYQAPQSFATLDGSVLVAFDKATQTDDRRVVFNVSPAGAIYDYRASDGAGAAVSEEALNARAMAVMSLT